MLVPSLWPIAVIRVSFDMFDLSVGSLDTSTVRRVFFSGSMSVGQWPHYSDC